MGGRGNYAVTRLTTRSNTSLNREQFKSASTDKVNFLETKIAGASGSNEGGVYKGSDGIERYVKFYTDATQAHGEALANSIYRDLGIAAPKSITFDHNGKTAFASEIVHNTSSIGKPTTQGIAKQIMHGYAADVLMANRDVIGLVNDNIRVSNGKVVRIDNGSAFLHRAMGSRKAESDLNHITELDYFVGKSTQYAPIAKLAGINKVSDMGKNFTRQVNVIKRLETKYGGWNNYVATKFPTWKGTDRNRIVEMLNTRTQELIKKIK